MPSTKDQVHQVADQLPPSATLEDAIERLVFLAKIDRGLAESTTGHLTSHDDVARRYTK